MREYLASLVRETDNPIRARNVVRDYLQVWIQRPFEAEGYRIWVRIVDRKLVHVAIYRFPWLLHHLGLTGQVEEAFTVC